MIDLSQKYGVCCKRKFNLMNIWLERISSQETGIEFFFCVFLIFAKLWKYHLTTPELDNTVSLDFKKHLLLTEYAISNNRKKSKRQKLVAYQRTSFFKW